MINENTWISSKSQQSRGKVIEIAEPWGTTQFRVWFPKDDLVLIHSKDAGGSACRSICIGAR